MTRIETGTTMSQRALLVLTTLGMLTMAFAGCFDDGDAQPSDGTDPADLPPVDVTLFLHQQMFHPHPDAMLTAWVFSESAQPPTSTEFKPPVIRAVEGQTVRIQFTNTFDLNHTIHWHGIHVPWEMDGVPYLTQDPILPGESFTYEFVAKPAGTHFFHCHVDTPHHVDMGMYGVLIVEPATPDPYAGDREQTLVFDDWDSSHLHQQGNDPQMTVDSTTDPSGDPFNQVDRTTQQARDTYNNPQQPQVKQAYDAAGGNPARAQRDWYPETFAPWQPIYDTWTINGKSYPFTANAGSDALLTIKEGEQLKVRLINVGNTIFSIHLHGHHFQVTHTDGYLLPAPYWKDTLLIGPGERYDILITGDNPGIWMMHDHMSLHEMNNHISPGGIMTHLVYEDFMDMAEENAHDHGHAKVKASDFLGLYR